MLGIVMGRWLHLLSRVVLPVARRTGRTERWPPLPRVARPYVFNGFEGNQLTGDRAMFDWLGATIGEHRELQLAMPTLGWLAEAMAEMAWLSRQGRLDCPSLCLLGEREEIVVPEAVRIGAARMGARLDEIAGGRHDLLLEAETPRAEVWRSIDRFLGEQGL
jgi:lysophospholipase